VSDAPAAEDDLNGGRVRAALLKTALFTLVVPGTVAFGIPRLIVSEWGGPALFSFPWVLGFLPLALGAAIYLACAWDFAVHGLGTPAPVDPPKTLVVRGLYRYVRNPMYVGVLTAVMGQAVLFRSRGVLLYAASVLAGFFLFVVVYEEPTLARMFGEEYAAYRRAVPRFLPRITPWRP